MVRIYFLILAALGFAALVLGIENRLTPGLFAIAPVHDILRDPVRSSIGKFSSRIDIAALVLVLVLAAFVKRDPILQIFPSQGS